MGDMKFRDIFKKFEIIIKYIEIYYNNCFFK